jgi:tetratricopeptide (TPR) repeat protein
MSIKIAQWDAWLGDLVRLVNPAVGLGLHDPLLARARQRHVWARALAREKDPVIAGRLHRLLGQDGGEELLSAALRRNPKDATARLYRAEPHIFPHPKRALKDLEHAGSSAVADFYRGAALLSLKRYRAAEKKFTEVAGPRMLTAPAALLAAVCALRRRNPQRALKNLTRAARFGMDCAVLHWLKAFAFQERGDGPHARRAVEAAMRRFSEIDPLDSMLGSALAQESAVFATPSSYTMELLDRAVTDSSEPAWALGVRAETRRAPQFLQYKLAVDDLERAVKLAPRAAWQWTKLGRAYINVNEYAKALAALEKAVKLEPDAGWIRAWRGECRRRMRKPGAMSDLRRAVRQAPDYPFAHAWLGAALRGAGRLEEAAKALETSLVLEPNYEWSFSELFQVRKRQRRWGEAARLVTSAFEKDPKFTWAREGKTALQDLDRAIKDEPDNSDLRAWRAWALMMAGRTAGARRDLQRAMRVPTAFAHYVHAELDATSGKPAAARRHYDSALELCGAGPYWAGRGTLRCAVGDLKGAVSDLESAVILSDTTARYRTALGAAYAGLERYDRALENLNLALGICPKFPQAEELRDQVLALKNGK